MSTIPVVPAPSSATPITASKTATVVTTVASHPLIHLIVVATLVYGGVVGFEDLVTKHDASVAVAQLKKEGVDTTTTTALLAQLQTQQAADEARDAQAQATILSLISKMKAGDAATKKQVQTDSTLDLQSAAARLATQTKSSDVGTQNGLVTMSLPLTRIVVADLDELPQAQADVTNLQGQLTAETTRATDVQSELDTAQQAIAADKTELIQSVKADNAACKVQVDAQAAKDRKRGIWVAIGSFVGGVILGSRL